MTVESYDLVVVGGGTGGCFAAITAQNAGLDVVLLERKSKEEAGYIACGDALKGKSTFPDVLDRDRLAEESFSNPNITRAVFENPQSDEVINIPFGDSKGAVVDRYKYGQVLLDETRRAGVDIQYETVVKDVVQDNGSITGVSGVQNGDAVTFTAPITIDGAGALSILQDSADFSRATFDTNVNYQQFCSAYREILEVEEPVEWDDAIVFKPTKELGYLWYFPRSPTVINAGLGFQMNKPPMKLVESLKQDLRSRPEFKGASVRETLGGKDKLGAALPTRRPYDSAVAPGFMAVGDAAGHVNPTTGGGIPGAAKAGHWAAEVAVDAISSGDTSESALWEYNSRVMRDFGMRFAAMDLYNIWGTAHDVSELVDIVSAVPGQQLVDILGKKGSTSMPFWLKLKTLLKTFGHWDMLLELYRVNKKAEALKEQYDVYPTTPSAFENWQADRDSIMDDVYEIAGADPKY